MRFVAVCPKMSVYKESLRVWARDVRMHSGEARCTGNGLVRVRALMMMRMRALITVPVRASVLSGLREDVSRWRRGAIVRLLLSELELLVLRVDVVRDAADGRETKETHKARRKRKKGRKK